MQYQQKGVFETPLSKRTHHLFKLFEQFQNILHLSQNSFMGKKQLWGNLVFFIIFCWNPKFCVN